ncbi:hypothetical protein PG994_002948 [Apiospora phragmitis]|uniref:Uncharacterized protein n=1 Tax=Apiospora phragmitis TaxID=2905665 RepID=A0ABR1W6M7_9PEZI
MPFSSSLAEESIRVLLCELWPEELPPPSSVRSSTLASRALSNPLEPTCRALRGQISDVIWVLPSKIVATARRVKSLRRSQVGPVCDPQQAATIVSHLLQGCAGVVGALQNPVLAADLAEGLGQQRRVHDVELLWRVAVAQDQEHGHHRPDVVCDEAGMELGTRELAHPDGKPGCHADFLDSGCLPRRLLHGSSRCTVALDRRQRAGGDEHDSQAFANDQGSIVDKFPVIRLQEFV